MKEYAIQLQKSLQALPKKTLAIVGVAFLFGAFAAFWLRFSLVQENKTHYHANFALYVNGARDEFNNFTFYEEVAACSADAKDDPKVRVHMHDNINYVIHVHDNAVTWSDFFLNIGYTLGDKVLATGSGVYVDDQDGKNLRFLLNGNPVTDIAGQTIKSEDVLLVDYGSDQPEKLVERYKNIVADAHDYNLRNDPSSCTGSKDETFSHRFRRTLGLDNNH